MRHRFFIQQPLVINGRLAISDKEQLRHLRALRIKKEEGLEVFDGQLNSYGCQLESLTKDKALLRVVSAQQKDDTAGVHLAVACAIPKNSRFEDIVDKLTQLGVSRIIPLETERVIVRLDAKKAEIRLGRWRKIARAAAGQSKRNNLPLIGPLMTLAEALEATRGFDLRLIPHLSGVRKPLRKIIAGGRAQKIAVFIGPEGDFTEREINLALRAGCVAVSLGPLVLRVETAAVAAAGFIMLNAKER